LKGGTGTNLTIAGTNAFGLAWIQVAWGL